MSVPVTVIFTCGGCRQQTMAQLDQVETEPDLSLEAILTYNNHEWFFAQTSSNSTEAFCSERCVRKVLP